MRAARCGVTLIKFNNKIKFGYVPSSCKEMLNVTYSSLLSPRLTICV